MSVTRDAFVMHKAYVNLTNGVEAITRYGLLDYGFVRIRSTDCEKRTGRVRWDSILRELDSAFLLDLARGKKVIVYDFSENGRSHAVRIGITWVTFALNWFWLGKVTKTILNEGDANEEDVTSQYKSQARRLSMRTKQRVKYFRKFLQADLSEVHLEAFCEPTVHDGDMKYYRKVLGIQ